MEFFSLIPITVITFLPILLWGYIFSYLDNSPLGARRFGMGILAGAISVVPVLFMGDIMTFVDMTRWSVFPLLLQGDNTLGLTISLLVTVGLIAASVFVFSLGIFFENLGKSWKIFLKNTVAVLGIGILFSFLHFLLFRLDIFDAPLANG